MSELRDILVKIREILIDLGLTAVISEIFSEIEKVPTAVHGETGERLYLISEKSLASLKAKYLKGG